MKKVIFALFLMSLFGFVLQSCCKDDDDPPNGPTHLQTILVYMPWSGDASYTGLYDAFQKNLKDIESAIVKENGLYGTTRVLVFITDSLRKSDLKPVSQLYEILFDEKSKTCTHNLIKFYSGDVDYTTAEGIATILNDVNKTVEGKGLDFGLIIGCHGAGWTQKDIWKNYPYDAKSHRLTAKRKLSANGGDAAYESTRFFGSTADRLYATDVETLAEGIRKSDFRTKTAFILFDDCYMANAEVAYELRDVTNYLIASTSEIMSEGMPYADMWKHLVSRSAEGYAQAANSFYQHYSNRPMNPCGAIAVIDCREMERLAVMMKQINAQYTFDESQFANLQGLDGFLDSSQSEFDKWSRDYEHIFYDMGDYVGKLCSDPILRQQFEEQLSKTVIQQAVTQQIYSAIYGSYYGRKIDVNTFSGLTISDPSRHFVALRGKERTAWWKATH